MTTILVMGEDGMLAREVIIQLSRNTQYTLLNPHILEQHKTFKTQYNEYPELDIRDNELIQYYFTKLKPDIIVNTAAIVNTDKCDADKDLSFSCNVIGSHNIISACKKYHAFLIHFETTAMLDCQPNIKLYTETSQINPKTYYSLTKYLSHLDLLGYFRLDDVLLLRICFVYGAQRDTSSNISKIIHASANREKCVTLNISSEYKKDYLYISDFGTAFMKLLENNSRGIYNISYGNAIKYSEIINLLLNKLEHKPIVIYNELSEYLYDHVLANIKLKSLGWRPRITLDKGLSLAINNILK